MRTAEQWTALYEDGGSPLNDPPRHIADIIREIQREAFDAGAINAVCVASARLRGRLDMRAVGRAMDIDVTKLPNRP